MPEKQKIRRLILAVLGFLIILLERITAELSLKRESYGSHRRVFPVLR